MIRLTKTSSKVKKVKFEKTVDPKVSIRQNGNFCQLMFFLAKTIEKTCDNYLKN